MSDWFADAKLGIWNHWGPQSAAEYGDWYARRMYVQGEPQYQRYMEHYGHPSQTGFADVIKSWKADKFDADYLVGLYKKARAKYYVAMATTSICGTRSIDRTGARAAAGRRRTSSAASR
jgi:alpha-L-fucosidase